MKNLCAQALVKLSCIIVNHNLSYLPGECIKALKASRVNFSFEIIVVDNASREESIGYLREMAARGEIVFIDSGANLGYGRANNLGAKRAKGEYLLILNPDVSVEPDALQKMADHLDAHPDIGILGPQLYFWNGQIQDSSRRFMRPSDLLIKRTPLQRFKFFKKRMDEYLMADFDRTRMAEVDLVTGACFMAPKAAFEKVGGFDPRYFLFMEDADLCRKMWEAGKKVVYLPEARALHYHKRLSEGGISALLGRKTFWIHLASAAKYFWKWRGKSLPRRRAVRAPNEQTTELKS